jgi:hypothetical protein
MAPESVIATVDFTWEFPTYPDADGQMEEWLNNYRAGGIPVDRTDEDGTTRLVFRFPDPRMVLEFAAMLKSKGL